MRLHAFVQAWTSGSTLMSPLPSTLITVLSAMEEERKRAKRVVEEIQSHKRSGLAIYQAVYRWRA